MLRGDHDRLAALLGGSDLTAARAAIARATGTDLARLAFVILQNRSAAEAASASAIAAAVSRADTAGWRPHGAELATSLAGWTLAAALRGYDRTREVDPLEVRRASALPADPLTRAVAAGVLLAGLPPSAAARAAGIGERRARRLLRNAATAAGSERQLAEAMAARAGPLQVDPAAFGRWEADDPSIATSPRAQFVARLSVAAVALTAVLVVLAAPRPPAPDGSLAAPSRTPVPSLVKGPPVATEAGVLPTLESCGIGPPDARLAFAGWLTVEDLGAAPPDAAPDEAFYALVPAGDVAWNPPGVSRRIMPAVRGRLACLSTASGLAPTVVGLPAGWTPPPNPRHERLALADCRIRPTDARLAYRGWLTAAQLGEPVPRPLYAIVSERPVRWAGPTRVPWPPTREQRTRFACVIDPETDEVRALALPDDWQPPRTN